MIPLHLVALGSCAEKIVQNSHQLFFHVVSDRKMDLKLFMTKSKDGGLMWCGTSGKVNCLNHGTFAKRTNGFH